MFVENWFSLIQIEGKHEFLKHYGEGMQSTSGEKPLHYTNMVGIEIYEIKVSEHKSYYAFFNSEEIVEEFLQNIRERFQNRNSGSRVIIKSGFSIENDQPVKGIAPISGVRYWSTVSTQMKTFDDFVYFSLKKDILRRVIINTLTGSSWEFRKFN